MLCEQELIKEEPNTYVYLAEASTEDKERFLRCGPVILALPACSMWVPCVHERPAVLANDQISYTAAKTEGRSTAHVNGGPTAAGLKVRAVGRQGPRAGRHGKQVTVEQIGGRGQRTNVSMGGERRTRHRLRQLNT